MTKIIACNNNKKKKIASRRCPLRWMEIEKVNHEHDIWSGQSNYWWHHSHQRATDQGQWICDQCWRQSTFFRLQIISILFLKTFSRAFAARVGVRRCSVECGQKACAVGKADRAVTIEITFCEICKSFFRIIIIIVVKWTQQRSFWPRDIRTRWKWVYFLNVCVMFILYIHIF